MPTVNPLGLSTLRAERYLAKRDAAGSYYPPGHWAASQIGLLPMVLNILAPGRNHGLRATYLGIVHDQFPHGRKTAQYEKLVAPNPCPLCDQPDSLEHVVLECENLRETRLEVKHTTIFRYLPPGGYVQTRQPMPERVRKYMYELLQYAFQTRPHLTSDMDAAAIWLNRPQQFTLDSLDAFSAQKFNSKDIRRLRAELLKAGAQLTRSAHRLIQERNTKAAGVNVGLATPPMTATRFSPISVTSTMTDFYPMSTPANWPQNSTPLQTSASAPPSSEQQQPSHGPLDRASQSPSGTATGFTQNSDAAPLFHSQTTEGTTGHLLSTQETVMNSPQGSPPPTAEPHPSHQPSQMQQRSPLDRSEAWVPQSVLTPLHSQMTYQPRRNPNRPGRPPQGNTDHLVLLADIVHHGRLPDDYQLTSALVPIEPKPDDMADIWVTASHHCPDGGLACFLQLQGPYVTRAGSLVAQYFGKDTATTSKETRKSRADTYRAAMDSWARSDYILAHARALYAVDGAKNCGPAYINDGFDKVNVYFSYNSDANCMEVRTTGPMLPGKYELLVNYDQPQYPSSYWTPDRRSHLPPETLALLEATYPARTHACLRVPKSSGPPNKIPHRK
jgi:hypothetical protein